MSAARIKKKYAIAIDGPSGSGKSTVARAVADRLGYVYIDTGAMYRALALGAIRHHITPDAVAALEKLLHDSRIDLSVGDGAVARVLLNDEDVTEAIRTPEVNAIVPAIAAHKRLRRIMVERQRQLGSQGGVVMDGRDIGTVVLPHADLKVFLVASPEVRAFRRWIELKQEHPQLTLAEVQQQLAWRDAQDTSRAESPLRRAPDAIEVDSSAMSIADVVQHIIDLLSVVSS